MDTKRQLTATNSRRDFLKIASVGAASAVVLPSLNSTAAAADENPVIIGSINPMTGGAAADGIEYKRGLEMAADEINAMGGILGRPIKMVFEDSESKGDDVIVRAAQRLIDSEKASALVCGYNLGSQTALQNVAADASIVYMHADTSRAHTELVRSNPKKYWGSFMYDPDETFYGIAFLDFIRNLEKTGQIKPANKKIAVITGPITYSINIANAIKDGAKKYGYEVSLFETVQAPISEWGPTLAKLRADPPGFIAVTHFFPADQAQFMLQFVANPTNSLVYMQYGASIAAFRDIAGDASEGVLYAATMGVLQDEIGKDFQTKYLSRTDPKASANGGVQTYSALHAFAVAAALAGGVGEAYEDAQNRKVADRLRTLIYRSPCGTVRFNPETQSAYSYPAQTIDSSLGMPHLFSQIKTKTETGAIIAPAPYTVAGFDLPKWMKA